MPLRSINKQIFDEYEKIFQSLYKNNYLIEHNSLKSLDINSTNSEITWSTRNSLANITFKELENAEKILSVLLKHRQYNFLFYDKSVLQYELCIENEEIIKQRILFIKKSSYVRSFEEVNELEKAYDTMVELDHWFDKETGVPVLIRVDYDPKNYEELFHSKSHFVISNIRNCRIPMKGNISLSMFIEFILQQVYNDYDIKFRERIIYEEEISKTERLDLHINWNL